MWTHTHNLNFPMTIEIPLMVTGILSVEVLSDQLQRITANPHISIEKTSLLRLLPHIFNKFLYPYIYITQEDLLLLS